jgi:hypothetical protein
MVIRMKITLEEGDFSELVTLAFSELRTPEGQLLFILRKELSMHKQEPSESDPPEIQENSICKEVTNGN